MFKFGVIYMYIDLKEFINKPYTVQQNLDLMGLMRLNELYEVVLGNISFSLDSGKNEINRPILILKIYGKISTLCQVCLEMLELSIDNNITVPLFSSELELIDKNHAGYDGIVMQSDFDVIA